MSTCGEIGMMCAPTPDSSPTPDAIVANKAMHTNLPHRYAAGE